MTAFQTSACRSCQAAVVWAVNVSTLRPAPIDAKACDDGNCRLIETPGGARYAVLTSEQIDGEGLRGRLFTNHFMTCPQREEHRRSRPSRPARGRRAAAEQTGIDFGETT